MGKKYEFTGETTVVENRTLHRIRALRDFWEVRAGDPGGWIESEYNLSGVGNCWVYGDAQVYDNARVSGNAWVYGDAKVYGGAMVFDDANVHGNAKVYGSARVYGNAEVSGNARVYDNAKVSDNAQVYGDAHIFGNAQVGGNAMVKNYTDCMVMKNFWSSGRWITYTRSNRMWKVGCFHGTGEELVKQAYADSEEKGKCYEAVVNAVEKIYDVLGK